MFQNVKEIRESTGMSQKVFAETYGIPVGTLRNWEQGTNSPAPYILNLLARALPSMNSTLKEIYGKKGRSYYYDKNQNCILDIKGNKIFVQEDLEEIKEQNLALYLDDLFDSFYEIQEKFDRDCRYDREEDILWT